MVCDLKLVNSVIKGDCTTQSRPQTSGLYSCFDKITDLTHSKPQTAAPCPYCNGRGDVLV